MKVSTVPWPFPLQSNKTLRVNKLLPSTLLMVEQDWKGPSSV